MDFSSGSLRRWPILRIVGTYAIAGGLWIYFSDTILIAVTHNPVLIEQIAVLKGFVYVALTSLLLYALIARHVYRNAKTEDLLKKSEEKYRTLHESLRDGYVFVDMSGLIKDSNEAYQQITGYTGEELLHLTYIDITPSRWHKFEKTIVEEQVRSKDYSDVYEKEYWRKDGVIVPVELRVFLVKDEEGKSQGMWALVRDISERKQADTILKASETKFRSIFESSHDAIGVSKDGILVIVNPAYAKMFGYNSEHELLESPLLNLFAPSERETVARSIRSKANREETPIIFITRALRKDGSEFDVEMQISAYFTNNELNTLLVLRDISERQEMVDALRKSEEYYRLLFHNNPFPLWVIDRQTFAFLAVNEAAAQHYGYTEEEFLSMTLKDIRPEEDIPMFLGTVTKGEGQLREPGIWRHKKKDGTIIDVEITTHDIEFEGKSARLVLANDVTKRKEAEEELTKTKILLEQTFEQSPIPMVLVSMPDMIVRIANPAYREYLDIMDEPSPVGKPLMSIDSSFKDYNAQGNLDLAKDLPLARALTGQNTKQEERMTMRKDGTTRWELVSGVPIYNDSGEIIAGYLIMLDISDRKRAEILLRQSEEKFRIAFITSPDSININRLEDGMFVSINEGFTRIAGYTEADVIGKTARELNVWVNSEDREKLTAGLNKYGKVENMEALFCAKDGTILNGLMSASLIQFNGVPHIISITRDITGRKKAEEALRVSESKYRDLVEQINEVIFSIDMDGIFSYISPTAEMLSGYRTEEIIGRSIRDFIYPDFLQNIQEQFKKALSGYLEPLEYRIRIKSGESLWMRCSIKPIRDGNRPAGFRGVLTDITTRKQIEESLNLLSHTVKSISECVIITDLHNKVLFTNQAFQETHGRSEIELIGKSIEELDILIRMHDQDIPAATLAGGWQGEILSRKKDGTIFPMFLSTSVVRNEKGEPIACVGTATDITEQKRLQQELLHSQKMVSIGTLAGGIAHDFNNILNIILGYSALLEKRKSDPEKFSEYVQAINHAVERGTALVRQILTFARKTGVEFELVSIYDLIHELFSMLQQTFPKTVLFRERLEPGLPMLYADHSQLHQVLMNLCVNARDAMPQGGTISIEASHIAQEMMRERFPKSGLEEYLCLSVEDTGDGMDEATRSRIFDPFFTTKEKGKGTGLGLAVVYGIIQSHHGFIEVESEKDRGTIFHIYLPLQKHASSMTVNMESMKAKNIHGCETILIVEDEAMLLEVLSATLEMNGYSVLKAVDGRKAIDLYEQNREKIAAVITDLGLPGMPGNEEFRRLRLINPEVKVIIASGLFDSKLKGELIAAGVDGFLQKPYKPDEIIVLLQDVLKRKQMVNGQW